MTWTLFYRTVDVASLEFDSVPEAHSDVPLRMNPASITSTKSKGMMSSHVINYSELQCCLQIHLSCFQRNLAKGEAKKGKMWRRWTTAARQAAAASV